MLHAPCHASWSPRLRRLWRLDGRRNSFCRIGERNLKTHSSRRCPRCRKPRVPKGTLPHSSKPAPLKNWRMNATRRLRSTSTVYGCDVVVCDKIRGLRTRNGTRTSVGSLPDFIDMQPVFGSTVRCDFSGEVGPETDAQLLCEIRRAIQYCQSVSRLREHHREDVGFNVRITLSKDELRRLPLFVWR